MADLIPSFTATTLPKSKTTIMISLLPAVFLTSFHIRRQHCHNFYFRPKTRPHLQSSYVIFVIPTTNSKMKICIVSPSYNGHLNPAAALGLALKKRGVDVVVASLPTKLYLAKNAGLETAEIGKPEMEENILEKLETQAGQSSGFDAVNLIVQALKITDAAMRRDLPEIIKAHKVDAILADSTSFGAMAIAERLNLPYGVHHASIHSCYDSISPNIAVDWYPHEGLLGQLRNYLLYLAMLPIVNKFMKPLQEYRKEHDLPQVPYDHMNPAERFRITQLPNDLEFPRAITRPHYFNTRPFYLKDRFDNSAAAKSKVESDFPWDQLDSERSLVYATLGTVSNGNLEIFHSIIEACRILESKVQLVVALGKKDATLDLPEGQVLPKGAIIVGYSPQMQVLAKASTAIIHGGVNSALECLAFGLPLVLLPSSTDQPGMSARLSYKGIGEAFPVGATPTPAQMSEAIEKVLTEPSYRKAAQAAQKSIETGMTMDHVAEFIQVGLDPNRKGPMLRDSEEAARILGPILEPGNNVNKSPSA